MTRPASLPLAFGSGKRVWNTNCGRTAPRKVRPLAGPTIDKIRRIMTLVYQHEQLNNFMNPAVGGNPMNWVSAHSSARSGANSFRRLSGLEILVKPRDNAFPKVHLVSVTPKQGRMFFALVFCVFDFLA